jgi:flagellar transcriptional activator FlhC
VVHPDDLHNQYVCGLCNMPARAGKTRKAKAEARTELTAAA